MYITYRRKGGVFALLTFAAVALAATLLSIAAAATLLVAALALGTVAFVARVVLPRWSWQSSVRPVTAWPQETIETTAVNPVSYRGGTAVYTQGVAERRLRSRCLRPYFHVNRHPEETQPMAIG
jgi:hypothetical protein